MLSDFRVLGQFNTHILRLFGFSVLINDSKHISLYSLLLCSYCKQLMSVRPMHQRIAICKNAAECSEVRKSLKCESILYTPNYVNRISIDIG